MARQHRRLRGRRMGITCCSIRLSGVSRCRSLALICCSADGKVLLFAARSANQPGLYTYSLDELSKEPPVARQLTSTPGRKTDYAFSPDAKDVFYLENGSVKSITVESR